MTGQQCGGILGGMATDELRARADSRFNEALQARDLADPRPFYRAALKRLRERDAAEFQRATRQYETVLLPRLADPDSDAITEWVEYGRWLAELEGPGKAVQVAPDGRATPFTPPVEPGSLVLFLPDDPAQPVLVLSLPAHPTPFQEATRDLLV